MKNVKTVSIMMIILMVVVIVGFILLMIRKQTVTIGGETAELKSYFGKPKAPVTPLKNVEKTDNPA